MYRLLVLFLICGFNSIAQPTNVLFIGNSYTHMNALCKIYQNLANSKGKHVFGDTIAVSGSTLKGHTERANTYKKMQAKDWDYVFIQGFSRELSYDSATIAKETIPYAQQLIDSLKKYNPCIKIYYYMTWGYANGYIDSLPDDTYELMQERIQQGYLQLSEATGGYPIAPVGMVWKTMREKYPETNLYAPDNAHPSHNGSYVAACTFYTAIYKESPIEGTAPKKVSAEVAKQIEQTAAKYVLSYYKKYNLDTIQIEQNKIKPKVNFIVSEKWLSVTLTNKSVGGSSYFWEFGDGKTSRQKNAKHYYSKPGKYTITLYVKKNCEWYTYKKTVTIEGPTKPKPKASSN